MVLQKLTLVGALFIKTSLSGVGSASEIVVVETIGKLRDGTYRLSCSMKKIFYRKLAYQYSFWIVKISVQFVLFSLHRLRKETDPLLSLLADERIYHSSSPLLVAVVALGGRNHEVHSHYWANRGNICLKGYHVLVDGRTAKFCLCRLIRNITLNYVSMFFLNIVLSLSVNLVIFCWTSAFNMVG